MFSKFKILTMIISLSLALSACSQEPWKGTINVEFISSDSSSPILESYLVESAEYLVHANFTGQEIEFKFNVKIVEGSEIPLFAGIQVLNDGDWETISKLEQVALNEPTKISLSSREAPNEIHEFRIAVWENSNESKSPINYSFPFKAVFWDYQKYYDAFNELRKSSNIQLEHYLKESDSGCRKAMKKDEVKYGKGNISDSTISRCMRLVSEYASNDYNVMVFFQTEVLALGIPIQIQDEMIKYLYSLEKATENYKIKTYSYCINDSLGNSYAEYCLGEFPGSEETNQDNLDRDYAASRNALAVKMVSLGLPDFRKTG